MFAVGAPLQGIISFHLHFNVRFVLFYAMLCTACINRCWKVFLLRLTSTKTERMGVLSTIFVPRHNQEWLRSIFTYTGYMSYIYIYLSLFHSQYICIFRNELNENAEPTLSLSLPKKTLIHDVVICFCHSHHIQLVHQLPLSYAVCHFHADNHRMNDTHTLIYTLSEKCTLDWDKNDLISFYIDFYWDEVPKRIEFLCLRFFCSSRRNMHKNTGIFQ